MNESGAAAKTTACKSSHSLPDDLHDTQLTICRCSIFWHMQSCRKWDTVHNGGLLYRGGGLSIHQSSRWPQNQKSLVSAILFKDWKQKSTSQHFLSYRLLHDLVSLKCKNWSWEKKKASHCFQDKLPTMWLCEHGKIPSALWFYLKNTSWN